VATFDVITLNIICCYIGSVGDEIPTLESLQFNLVTLEAATSHFSFQNKIGSGGFGEVYKVNTKSNKYTIFFIKKMYFFLIHN
jgi:hypothetical protein